LQLQLQLVSSSSGLEAVRDKIMGKEAQPVPANCTSNLFY